MCPPLTFWWNRLFSLLPPFPSLQDRAGPRLHPSDPPLWASRTHARTHTAMQEAWPSFFSLRHRRRPNAERERKRGRGKKKHKLFRTISSQDVRPRCLPTSEPLTAAHLTADPPAALLPLLEGGQSGLGAGEETATAWRAAKPAAHQTHPHILSVSEEGGGGGWGVKDCTNSLCINLPQILVHLPKVTESLWFSSSESHYCQSGTQQGYFVKRKSLHLKILRAETPQISTDA